LHLWPNAASVAFEFACRPCNTFNTFTEGCEHVQNVTVLENFSANFRVIVMGKIIFNILQKCIM